MTDFQVDINKSGLDIECDMCLDYDATIIIWPLDDRATELRLCKAHAEQLRDFLNESYPVSPRK